MGITMVAAIASAEGNIPNPVIPNVADIGVMKYNGKYYLGGCRTDGDFYISDDLVNWTGPVHVIDMDNDWSRGSGCGNNQIHANDMLYDNGTIHAYWSVNYWGRDKHAVHIVHSEAADPMGPYVEPVKDRWMDNRIDPKIFRDDDGQLYMYMVRFTNGNTIWARKMKNWREFDEKDPDGFVCQFASLPNTWERMDNAVAEGPWVIKYHGQYYMMYNANHTGGEWGNYQLGVAQARTPMGFNNGNKYSHPVVLSNQKALEDDNVDILKFSTGKYDPLFAYVTERPASGWTGVDFDDSAWSEGLPGFARKGERGSTVYRMGTRWEGDTIWTRKHFKLDNPSTNLALRLTAKGPSRIYLNGTEVHAEERGVYRIINLTPEMKRALREGENVLAVECASAGRRGAYLNVELFDMQDKTADPEIVWTPGQPNILRGPNGMEWWLIYMANDNGKSRSQYVDRVYFHGDKMVVDGITHGAHSGYHPRPAAPAYGDTFDGEFDLSKWAAASLGEYKIEDGELHLGAGENPVLAPSLAAKSYLWEVNVKPESSAGIYALWKDAKNNVKIVFDQSAGECQVLETIKGKTKKLAGVTLRPDFRWGVYHQLRVERDGADLILSIDEMRNSTPIETSLTAAAVPGLYAASQAAYDGLIYTIGFDDGNDRMNGWDMAEGSLLTTERGACAARPMKAFKGEPGRNYEFVSQVSNLGDEAKAGIYALYQDENNYVKALLDAPARALVVSVVVDGAEKDRSVIPVDYVNTLYYDVKYTDSYEKGYVLDCPTTFDKIYLKRYDVANRNVFTDNRFDKDTPTVAGKEIFVDNMFDLMDVAYEAEDGSWINLPTDGARVAAHPLYNEAAFAPVKAKRLRFINRDPSDGGHHIYDIRMHELFKDSYNLRAVREGDKLHIFVDGRELSPVPVAEFGPSTIGIEVLDGNPEFHGVSYWHK